MRLKNHTNIPSEWIREVIKAVRPSGISNFDVRISNCGDGLARGRAYTGGSSFHDRANPFVVASIARTDAKCRFITPSKNGYLPIPIGNRREGIVVIIAHELRHLWQAKCPKGESRRGMVWGARGRMSERDADAYALQMLRRYRRGELIG